MAQYISKSALVAEIERRCEVIANASNDNNRELAAIYGAQQCELINLVQFINTLEVKEEVLDRNDKTKLMRKCVKTAYERGYDMGALQTTNRINHNTKEVGLEKEVEDWVKTGPHTSYPWCTIPDAIRITAEHFFELGLKAKKGE